MWYFSRIQIHKKPFNFVHDNLVCFLQKPDYVKFYIKHLMFYIIRTWKILCKIVHNLCIFLSACSLVLDMCALQLLFVTLLLSTCAAWNIPAIMPPHLKRRILGGFPWRIMECDLGIKQRPSGVNVLLGDEPVVTVGAWVLHVVVVAAFRAVFLVGVIVVADVLLLVLGNSEDDKIERNIWNRDFVLFFRQWIHLL